MLIVIPTYKRNRCLRCVLQSLVQCHTDRIPEEIRVVVVNNYPPAAKEIADIVSHFSTDTRFQWEVLYREKTLLPVENWYSAIFEKSLENEVVFINSDDDLFMPRSLELRYLEVSRKEADLLLAHLGSTIFFYDDCQRLLCQKEPENTFDAEAEKIDFKDLHLFDPQHLSNHCYRKTRRLKACFDIAMSWCEELTWLDQHNRTINFPLLLTFALCHHGGKVCGLSVPLIVRGREIEEIISAKFGVPGWNHGFIHVCGLAVMNNRDLLEVKDLDRWRKNYLATYIQWFPTYPFDHRLSWRMIKEMHNRSGLKWHSLLSKNVLKGFLIVLSDWLGFRGRRLKKMASKESISAESFVTGLAKL